MPIDKLCATIGAALRVANACYALELAVAKHRKAVEIGGKPDAIRQLQAVVQYCEKQYVRKMTEYMTVAPVRKAT